MSHRICANPHHEITPAAHKSMGRWAGEAGFHGGHCTAATGRRESANRGAWNPYDVFLAALGSRRNG